MNDKLPISPDRGSGRRIIAVGLALVLLGAALGATAPAAWAQGKAPRVGANYIAFAKGRIDVAGGMVRLAAPRDGLIRSMHAEEGAEVRKGALLAQLDDRQAQLQLLAARNELREIETRTQPLKVKLLAAERELARIEPLMASQAVARAERDERRDQVSLLKAEIEAGNAQAAAGETRIKLAALEVELRAVRAPVDGRIIKRYARPGDSAVSTRALVPDRTDCCMGGARRPGRPVCARGRAGHGGRGGHRSR